MDLVNQLETRKLTTKLKSFFYVKGFQEISITIAYVNIKYTMVKIGAEIQQREKS